MIKRSGWRVALFFALMVIPLAGPTAALAQEHEVCSSGDLQVELPVRGFAIQSDNTRVELNMLVCNGTTEEQLVQFVFEGVPTDWKAAVRATLGAYEITRLTVEQNTQEFLRLRINPPGDQAPGEYAFTLKALSSTGALLKQFDITASVFGVDAPEETGEVLLESTFPVLRGPNTSEFEYEVAIRNRTGAELSVNLAFEAPVNWKVTFVPSFDEAKVISSVSMVDNATQRVKVKVEPPRQEVAGDYPVLVTVSNDDYSSQTILQVSLTGNPDMILTTPTGRLNLDATAGDPAPFELQVVNTGSADLQNVLLLQDPPEGWNVDFDPGTVPTLIPQTLANIEVTITPDKDAIPGDYIVRLTASSPQVFDAVVVRVTVTQSTIWGWFGIGLVILVLGGLVALFVRLGRR